MFHHLVAKRNGNTCWIFEYTKPSEFIEYKVNILRNVYRRFGNKGTKKYHVYFINSDTGKPNTRGNTTNLPTKDYCLVWSRLFQEVNFIHKHSIHSEKELQSFYRRIARKRARKEGQDNPKRSIFKQ